MLDRLLETAREAHADLTGRRGVPPSRLCPGGSQEHFGFRDAVGGVVIEGARPRSRSRPASSSSLAGQAERPRPMLQPEALGLNETCAALRGS
jgi:hypothetical protein